MSSKTALIVLSHNAIDVTRRFMKCIDDFTNDSDIHLIMIDNGSQDGSEQYLAEEARSRTNMTYESLRSNLGVIGGRNHGFEIYKNMDNRPEYVMFLDNDQYVQDGWLSQHHQVLKETEASVVGVEAWLLNDRFFPIKQAKRPSDVWSYVGCGGMLMKGEIPEKLGMFDTIFNPAYFEDPDFCFRVMDSGGKLAWNFNAHMVHMAHQTLGKNSKRMQIFQASHSKFSKKWKGRRFRPQRQHLVPSLRK